MCYRDQTKPICGTIGNRSKTKRIVLRFGGAEAAKNNFSIGEKKKKKKDYSINIAMLVDFIFTILLDTIR
jgi:hypothetical protein